MSDNSSMPKSGHINLVLILGFSISFISGCGGVRTRTDIENLQTKVPPEQARGRPSVSKAPEEPFDQDVKPPPPVALRAPRVGVILGPGGLKSFAEVGVLKELLQAKIPIDHIVGLEWGALIAALYAQKGLIHEVEWKLSKLRGQDFQNKSFFSKKGGPVSFDVLKTFLDQNLDNKKNAVSFGCPSLSLGSGVMAWQGGDNLLASLEKCVPCPPLLRPTAGWACASFSIQDAVSYLKQKGAELIVFVNVLNPGELLPKSQDGANLETTLYWQELKRYIGNSKQIVHEFIDVPTRRFDLMNFDNRQALFAAGELAGREAAERLASKYGF